MRVSRRAALIGASGLAAGVGATALLPAPGQSSTNGTEPDDLQHRYDALAAGSGGTLTLAAGTYRTNLIMHSRIVHLNGAGRGATILTPADPARPVLTQAYRSAEWDTVTIADLTIQGFGKGVAIDYGDTDADRFSGRTNLRNIRVTAFETCIRRATGNIGLSLHDCQFDTADYHIWGRGVRTTDGSIMHNGVLTARGCHFQGASKAVVYVESAIPGSGLIAFDQCIFENNPGSVFVFARFESRDGVPGISIRSCWNEANATGGDSSSIQLGGRRQLPVFLLADRVAQIEFTDTPVGTMVLKGDTTVLTKACALDLLDIVASDPASSVTHDDARVFGGKTIGGLTRSLANGNQRNAGPAGAIFHLPHRIGIVYPEPTGSHSASTCAAPIIVEGRRRVTTHSVADAVLPGVKTSQQLEFVPDDMGYVTSIAVPGRSFLAWTFTYRKVGGADMEFVVAGREGVSTATTLKGTDWTTIGGVAFIEPRLDQLGLLLHCATPASLRIGGYQMSVFTTRAAATEMINDRLFRAGPG